MCKTEQNKAVIDSIISVFPQDCKVYVEWNKIISSDHIKGIVFCLPMLYHALVLPERVLTLLCYDRHFEKEALKAAAANNLANNIILELACAAYLFSRANNPAYIARFNFHTDCRGLELVNIKEKVT